MAEPGWDVLGTVSPTQVFAPPYAVRDETDQKPGRQLPKPVRPQFTSEHRGMLTAVGVALLTVGVTGLVSLLVVNASTKNGLNDATGIVWACWVLIWVASLCLWLVWISLRHERDLDGKLARYVVQGGQLLDQSWGIGEDDEDAVNAFEQAVSDWTIEVAKAIFPYSVPKAVHFRNQYGQLIAIAFNGTTGIKAAQLQLDTRLTRLGEIVGKG
jgi:hypothetical protein